MLKKEIKKQDISVIAIVLVNLIPLFGVLFYQWSLFSILILYWCESAVIGFYTILKMILAGRIEEKSIVGVLKMPKKATKIINILFKIFLIPFFCIHYGGFMGAHLLFIFVISSINNAMFINEGISLLAVSGAIKSIMLALIGLFISHGLSFFTNFIGNREYKKSSVAKLMISPYKRITLMHLTILFGGFLIVLTGIKHTMLVLFIALKIFADLRAHKKEHSETYKAE